jgi:hypothetical protein
MNPNDDLTALASEEPSPELDARVRRAARAELSLATGPSWRRIGTVAWTRVALPAAITVTVVGYLHWAMTAANALYR